MPVPCISLYPFPSYSTKNIWYKDGFHLKQNSEAAAGGGGQATYSTLLPAQLWVFWAMFVIILHVIDFINAGLLGNELLKTILHVTYTSPGEKKKFWFLFFKKLYFHS